MKENMVINSEKIIVYLNGEIDHHNTIGLRARIDAVVNKEKPKKLCLDFDKVTFMDSSGVGLVMGRFKTVQGIGGKLEVRNLSESAYRVMKMSGLERIAKIERKTEEKVMKK